MKRRSATPRVQPAAPAAAGRADGRRTETTDEPDARPTDVLVGVDDADVDRAVRRGGGPKMEDI